jgi:serine/threonine protein kinase
MVTGRLPFLCPRNEWISSEERRRKLMIQINRGLTSIQEKAMCQTSSECRNLINRLLVPSARDRITIQEILDHPFLMSKNNFYLCPEDDVNISNHLAVMHTKYFNIFNLNCIIWQKKKKKKKGMYIIQFCYISCNLYFIPNCINCTNLNFQFYHRILCNFSIGFKIYANH